MVERNGLLLNMFSVAAIGAVSRASRHLAALTTGS